ncbi:hypothetical protein OAR00_00005, partial [Alphaproteobacteria bacterium]|nr:hypothetical protein [Alphaproteobacteria bacterium]
VKHQYVTYSISHTLLKQHFKLENGVESPDGFLKTLVPVEVKIRTPSRTITKAGNITIAYYKNGALEIIQFDPLGGHLKPGNIFQEYPDDISYKESMKNEVISCKIMP